MLFISHSKKDKAVALDVHSWLLEKGYAHSQIFLDSDAESGIQAGSEWKESLHDGLKHCTALIVLYSNNWRGSDWCSYELGYARAIGKPIFPVLIEDTAIIGMAAEYQAVLIWKDRNDACDRLWKSLQEQHLGPNDTFLWPHPNLKGDACPFPGLPAFDERYAAVYFGREPETQEVLALLRKMRDEGQPRLLMIHGGSGSGKSSLLKAGVLPRVGSPDWVVLPTLRPGALNEDSTIFDQLARNLVGLFPKDAKQPPEWKALRDRIQSNNVDDAAKYFFESTQDLTMGRNQKDATVLLAIDQYEEFLSPSASKMAAPFMRFLRAVFACKNGRLLAIGTIRSDYLDAYQRHPHALGAPLFRDYLLGPFPRERIPDVIVKPTQRAQVKVTSELLEKIEKDTPNSEALPLLAYTLEKLYRLYAGNKQLELKNYDDLGGMEGAIQKSIERIVPASLPAESLAALRLSFVKHLAQVNDKDEVVRLTARWSALPATVQPLLEEFVKDRLVVKSQDDRAEVAHEAMFRCWETLNRWLQGSGEVMRWRRDVRRDQASDKKWTGLRPAQLAVARNWPKTRRAELDEDEVNWIKQGICRQWLWRSVAASVFLTISVLGVFAWWQRNDAKTQANNFKTASDEATRAEGKAKAAAREANRQAANAYWQVAIAARNEGLNLNAAHSFLRAAQASDQADDQHQRRNAELAAQFAISGLNRSFAHDSPVNGIKVTGDESRLLSWSSDGAIKLWDMTKAEPLQIWRHEDVYRAIFTRDESRVLSWSSGGTLKLWDANKAEPLQVWKHDQRVFGAVFTRDESRVLSWSWDGTVKLWDVNEAKPLQIWKHDKAILGAVFARDESRVLAWSGDIFEIGAGMMTLSDVTKAQPLQVWKHHGRVLGAIFTPDESRVLAWGDREAWLLDATKADPLQIWKHEKEVTGAKFTRDKSRVLSWSADGTVKLWDVTKTQPLQVWKHHGRIMGAVFTRDESRVLAWGDHEALLLDATKADPLQIWKHEEEVTGAEFTRDESRVLSWSQQDGAVKLWNVTKAEPLHVWKLGTTVNGTAFAHDEWRVLSWGHDGAVRLWDITKMGPLQIWKHDEGVKGAVFTRDESRVLSWSQDGAVKLWDVTKVEPLQVWKHDGEVKGAVFTRDESHVLSWSQQDGAVKLWHVTKAEPLKSWKYNGRVFGAVFTRDESRVLSWGEHGAVLLDATNAEPLQLWKHNGGVFGAAFTRDESRVLACGEHGAMLFDATNAEPLQVWKHNGGVSVAVFTRDESRVLARGLNGEVILWDVTKAQPLQVWKHSMGILGNAVFTRDESRVLSWSLDGLVKLWVVTKAEPLRVWKHDTVMVFGAVFTRDDSRVLSWGFDGAVKLWDVTKAEPLQVWKHDSFVVGAVLANDESRLLSWSQDKTVKLWDVTKAEPLQVWKHDNMVKGAVFTRDESRVLSWSDDGAVKLWGVTKAEPLEVLKHGNSVNGAVFTRDESHILSWSQDGTIELSDAAVCETHLTPAERILELEVRSASRFDSAGHIVPLKSAEWLDLCREWDRVRTDAARRAVNSDNQMHE